MTKCLVYARFNVVNSTDLNGPCGFGGALADMEEPCAGRLALTFLRRRPTKVDDQRLLFKQAHKMRWFVALSDTNLRRYSNSSTFMFDEDRGDSGYANSRSQY